MNNLLKSKKAKLILLFIIVIAIVFAYFRINRVLDTSRLTPTEFEKKYK